MGNEASKHEAVEPPPEWDPTSNAKKFELVSPMSDLSDPSMFLHRRAAVSKEQQQGRTTGRAAQEPPARLAAEVVGRKGPGAVRQTPAGDRRRKSKVIATRDTAYQHEPRERELAPPSSFYFPTNGPTKESEESFHRIIMKRNSLSTGDRRASKESSNHNNNNKENNPQTTTPLLLKARRKVNQATTCLAGCFEESTNNIQLMRDNVNAPRAQRLSSELGASRDVVLQLDKERVRRISHDKVAKAPFDPYQPVDTGAVPAAKPEKTVLQFVDGAQQELTFNPVWRESHDGTYHEMSTTTGGNGRESEPTLTTKGSEDPRRVSDTSGSEFRASVSHNVFRSSTASSKQLSGPPSQLPEDVRLASSKENEDPILKSQSDLSPEDEARAFNLSREDSSKNVKALVSNLIHMYDRRKSTDEMSGMQKQASSKTLNHPTVVDPNGEYTRQSSRTIASARESLGASAATSHESSYWDAFYKDAQVLHHEDRVSYNPRQSSGSNNTNETPVVDLFGPERQQSLLGSISNSPELLKTGKSEDVRLFDTEQSKRNDPPVTHESPDDERAEDSSRILVKETQYVPEFSKPVTMIRSMKPKRRSCPVDLDITPKSSVMGFPAESTTKTAKSFDDVLERQPSDEEMVAKSEIVETSMDQEADRPKYEVPAYSKSSQEFSLGDDEISQGRRASFLDRRISANQVLTQTTLVSKTQTSAPAQSKYGRDEIKAALQQTPRASTIEPRSSFGSAFSYKDKDVFTPVTSCTTYPKGSPFRPRINVPDQTLAKAKLDQPSMYTQSFDDRRSSSSMQIRATESAPSVIESHDYRDIAYGCFLEDTPSTLATKKERALAFTKPSPSASTMSLESPMSTATSPGQPLLSEQVMDNAAFLFSPSYASGKSLGEQSAATKNIIFSKESERNSFHSTYSITTMSSRSRISARSQQSIRIPVSRSGNAFSPRTVNSGTASRKVSISDATASQKSVRFSEASSIEHSEAGSQKSRRSVTWDFSFQGSAPGDVNIPEIETKVSDLSETVFDRESLESASAKRSSVESIKSDLRQEAIKEETDSLVVSDETESRPSLTSTAASPASSKSTAKESSTPEEAVQTWRYCEFTKGVTPMLSRKQLAQATNSPVLRFKAAKNKFVGKKDDKVVAVKKKSLSIGKKKILPGRVHALASQFENGGPPLEPQSVESRIGATNSMDSATSNTVIPGERPMLRTPQIIGYTAKSYPNIFQRASYDSNSTHGRSNCLDKPVENTVPAMPMANNSFMMSATPLITNKKRVEEVSDDASDDFSQHSYGTHDSNDDSTFIQSVATLVQEGREVKNNKPMLEEDGQDDVEDDADERLDEVLDKILQSESAESSAPATFKVDDDMPCDEAADDFAELLLDNILGQDSSKDESESASSAAPKQSGTGLQLNSIVPPDDEDEESTFANILSAPTFSDESTTMSAVLAEQTTANLRHGAKTVQPHVQQQHRHQQGMPPSQALNLSPLQRTPMQASKWRELASLAQQEDSKRSIFRSSKKSKSKSKKGRDSNNAPRRRLSERDANVL